MIENLSFEELIIWCCKSNESLLRKEILFTLKEFGFEFQQDSYQSYRNLLSNKYNNVNNTLFIRGQASICLVAHTDVCRDHVAYEKSLQDPMPEPIVKIFGGQRIIQDKTCRTQVGGDDRLGVAIALWIAMHTNFDIAILLTTDEEIGLVSAEKVSFKELNEFDLLIQIDRGNNSNQIVNFINDRPICDESTKESLLSIAMMLGMPRTPVAGGFTDVYEIVKNDRCKNAVNLTCGYHNSKSDSGEEYININEALNTALYVKEIIKYFF